MIWGRSMLAIAGPSVSAAGYFDRNARHKGPRGLSAVVLFAFFSIFFVVVLRRRHVGRDGSLFFF